MFIHSSQFHGVVSARRTFSQHTYRYQLLVYRISHARYTKSFVIFRIRYHIQTRPTWYYFRFRIQLEKVRTEIVHRDGGGDDRRSRATIRPVDGLDRGTVDWSIDVPFSAVVLRENTIASSAEDENVRRGVLSDVPERKTDADHWLQTFSGVVVHNSYRHVGHRFFDAHGHSGYGCLRSVHAFVRNANVRLT